MTLSEAFELFKTRLELDATYQDVIARRHAAIRQCIENVMPGARTQLIGSLQRKTRIDPLSGLKDFDIDILVEMGSFISWSPPGQGIFCDGALNSLETAIKSNLKYRKMGVQEDRPAIIVPYTDGSIVEVVPAYRDNFPDHTPSGRAYYVPRASRWVLADYDYDADYVSRMNKNSKNLLIPCIKMLKAWRRNLAPALRSYHLEILTLNSMPDVMNFYAQKKWQITWQSLIYGFFLLAEEKLPLTVKIPGSLSEPADYYLQINERNNIISLLRKCADWIEHSFSKAESEAIKMWREIFGEPFPAG